MSFTVQRKKPEDNLQRGYPRRGFAVRIRPRIHIIADSQALYTQYLQRIAQQKTGLSYVYRCTADTQYFEIARALNRYGLFRETLSDMLGKAVDCNKSAH